MAVWTTPKTNWTTSDGIGDTDLNRIEENTEYLYDRDVSNGGHLRNYISGFTVNANSGSEGVYEIRVKGGIWSDSSGNYVDWDIAEMVKTFSASAWTAGAAGQARLDSATYSTTSWFWVFALYNPTTNAHDFAVDDSIFGNNLGPATAAGYTLSRRICVIRTSTLLAANGIIPMHYESDLKSIVYTGAIAARVTTGLVATAVTARQIILNDTLGGDLIPYDSTSPGYYDTGTVSIDITSSVAPALLDVWCESHFGTTWYDGIGIRKYFGSTGDVHTFDVAVPGDTIYVRSNATTTLHFVPRATTYSPDEVEV